MNERDELLMRISESYEAMENVKACENVLDALEEKRKKIRSIGTLILMFFALILPEVLAGGFIAMLMTPIVGEDNAIQTVGYVTFAAFFIVPFVVRSIRTKMIDPKIVKAQAALETAKSDTRLGWLPPIYRDSFSFFYISSYIQNMRADTLRDAINLFETEKHRLRLEYAAATGLHLRY